MLPGKVLYYYKDNNFIHSVECAFGQNVRVYWLHLTREREYIYANEIRVSKNKEESIPLLLGRPSIREHTV